MTRFTLASAHHSDATAAVVTFANGESITVADSPDHADTMYCADCEGYSTPVLRITILNDEEWDYADASAADKPLCSTCYGEELYDDVYAAEEEMAERAYDNEADRRYHEWRDEGGR